MHTQTQSTRRVHVNECINEIPISSFPVNFQLFFEQLSKVSLQNMERGSTTKQEQRITLLNPMEES